MNAGGNGVLPPGTALTDFDGEIRVRQGTVDIGAFEHQAPGIFRVDQTAAGPVENGLSWETAFTDLQTALGRSLAGDHIWLKAGTYGPAGPDGDRSATFLIPDGVHVYGGFSGGETSVGERDSNPDTNGTILSGDLNGDGNVFPNDDDNSYHVVSTAEGTTTQTRLDGLNIQDGHADGGSLDNFGAGAMVWLGSPNFVRANFKNNRAASRGGGVYSYRGAPRFESCEFFNYDAYKFTGSSGGGIYSDNSGTSTAPWFYNCNFRSNSAANDGGGLYLNQSNAQLWYTTFSDQFADRGGGLYISISSPKLIGVSFDNNQTSDSEEEGGAVFVSGGSSPVFEDARFTSNSATSGGALYCQSFSTNTLINVDFINNRANSGGAVDVAINTRFHQSGGSFVGNGSFLWNNRHQFDVGTSQSSMWIAGGTATVSDSIVHGSNGSGAGWAAGLGTDGGGNLDEDPLFIDDIDFAAFPRPAWDLRLWKGSPAVNAGANASIPLDVTDVDGDLNTTETIPFDHDQRDRILGTHVDMGAFEGGYTTFERTYPGLAPNADSNNNDLSNFFDYTLANDPLAPAGPIKPFRINREGEYPIIELSVRGDALEGSHALEVTSNFERWNPVTDLHATLIGSSWPNGDATLRVFNYELFRNGRVTPSFFRLRIDPPVTE